jgi:hypothetical protein
MLALEIDNPNIEEILKKSFKTTDEIKSYIYNLVVEDFEDKKLAKTLQQSNKKDFVEKKDIFEALDNI